MICLILTYHLKDKETRDAFCTALREHHVGDLCKKENGCIGYDYYLPCDNERDLLLIERWEDNVSLQAHTQQPHFLHLQELKKQFDVSADCMRFD